MFNRKKPYIRFHTHPDLLDLIPHPVPAYKSMPEWFKKLKPTITGQTIESAGTVKRCIPVLDAVSQGYIIPLWADLHVQVCRPIKLYSGGEVVHTILKAEDPEVFVGKAIADLEGQPVVESYEVAEELSIWMKFPELDLGLGSLITNHNWEQVGDLCDLKRFKLGQVLLKFTNPWVIETPKGWSVQIKNPANNFSNDILLLEGVVDTDAYYNEINFPYIWSGKEEGEWIIPKGTPLAHVIPFERTKVDLEVSSLRAKSKDLVSSLMRTKHIDRYKSLFWHKRKKD
jgi:hypothetical protein